MAASVASATLDSRVNTPGAPAAAHAPALAEVAHAVLAAAWRRRYVIIVPILLLPIIGGVIGAFVPRSYETRMSVLVQEPGKFNPFLEDLSVKSNLRDRMDGLRALLTSRHVLLGVAEDMKLLRQGATETEQAAAVSALASAVSVQLIGQEMVELRYVARRPQGMDLVLGRIGERFIERIRGPEDTSLRSSVLFLEKQLSTTQAQLNEAELALATFKSQNASRLPEMRTANLQRLAQLREQLSDREVRLAGSEGEVASVRQRLLQTDPVLGRLEQDIVATTSELALLRAKYTDDHSRVQSLLSRIERLEEERGSLLRAAAQSAPPDVARLWNMAVVAQPRDGGPQPLLTSQLAALEQARTRHEQLASETENLRTAVNDLSASIAASGEVERELHQRERDVALRADMTQQLRRRYEIARVTADLAEQQAPERIKVIDRPFEPTAPTKPMTTIFALVGLLAGIGLGIGLAVLMDLADQTMRRIRDVEKLMGVPVLARVPDLDRAGDVR
jgi:polysaccharide chain length determinant protein (PEP-CTERM system associated)